MRHTPLLLTAIILWLVAPAPAAADTFLTPYLGRTFNGTYAGIDTPNRLVYGADIMWLGGAGIGFGIDFAYHPNFFEPGDDEELFDFDSDGNVTTLMANLVIGGSGRGARPYISGGAGLLRTNIDGPLELFDIDDNAFGVNAGGGLRIGSEGFALRGDLRYFRSLTDVTPIRDVDLGDFSFWRASVGLSFGF